MKAWTNGNRCATCVGAVVLCALSTGCFTFGPRTISRDRFDYGAAVRGSRSGQMLQNIVALRYLQVPSFLGVNSVIAAYTYQGGVGVEGQAALDLFDETYVGGSANLGYVERPTITYIPLSGEEFSRRMLKEIPVELLFALGQSGWSPGTLFRIAVDRFGAAQNMGFEFLEGTYDAGARAEKLRIYDRVVDLLVELQAQDAYELARPADGDAILRFDKRLSPEQRALADELKRHLELDPDVRVFKLTDRLTDRDPDEIHIRTRSLLAIMSLLAQSVEVPDKDAASDRAISLPPELEQVIQERGPMRIRSQKKRPKDPYAAIRYRDHWFYVDGADHLSQDTFATLLLLFELLAPSGAGAAPVLTVPAR